MLKLKELPLDYIFATKSRIRDDQTKLLFIESNGLQETANIEHHSLLELPDLLSKNDVLVVNQSATIPSSFHGIHSVTGEPIEIRLVQLLHDDFQRPDKWRVFGFGIGDWREKTEDRMKPPHVEIGDIIEFSHTFSAVINHIDIETGQLWDIEFISTEGLWQNIYIHGTPTQYSYLDEALQIWDQQTIFSTIPSSVEAPSASLQLTWNIIKKLQNKGVTIVPVLHAISLSNTGIQEIDRLLPFPERYEISDESAYLLNHQKKTAGRIIAIGTSVTRALEDNYQRFGKIVAGKYVSSLIINREYKLEIVDGLLTGMHIPGESHLQLLEAFIPLEIVERGYNDANLRKYQWHEYGDLTLLLNPIALQCGYRKSMDLIVS